MAAHQRPQPVSLSALDLHLSLGSNAILRGVELGVPAGTTTASSGRPDRASRLCCAVSAGMGPTGGHPARRSRCPSGRSGPTAPTSGMVFQNCLFPHKSVVDNITLAPQAQGSRPTSAANSHWPSWTGWDCGASRSAAFDVGQLAAGCDAPCTSYAGQMVMSGRGHLGAGSPNWSGNPHVDRGNSLDG